MEIITYSVGDVDEGVVDSNNLNVITVDGVTEDLDQLVMSLSLSEGGV